MVIKLFAFFLLPQSLHQSGNIYTCHMATQSIVHFYLRSLRMIRIPFKMPQESQMPSIALNSYPMQVSLMHLYFILSLLWDESCFNHKVYRAVLGIAGSARIQCRAYNTETWGTGSSGRDMIMSSCHCIITDCFRVSQFWANWRQGQLKAQFFKWSSDCFLLL